MQMEKRCKEADCPGKLVPVPRSITSDCGIGWKAETADREQIEKIAEGLETEGFYETEM